MMMEWVHVSKYTVQGLYPFIENFLADTMCCLEEACQAVAVLSRSHGGLSVGEHTAAPIACIVSSPAWWEISMARGPHFANGLSTKTHIGFLQMYLVLSPKYCRSWISHEASCRYI